MSDPITPAPAVEDSLAAVVGRIQQTILALPRFRPADPDLARSFDQVAADLLDTLIQTAQAAAVDRSAVALAAELAQQRRDHALASQKLRDETDIAMKGLSVPFPFPKVGT